MAIRRMKLGSVLERAGKVGLQRLARWPPCRACCDPGPFPKYALEVFTKFSRKLCFPKWLKAIRNKLKSEKVYSLMILRLENTCKN